MTERAPALKGTGTSGSPDPLIGRLINDRFKITSVIARGGMGKVYRAEQAPLGRTCALKILDPHYAGEHDPEFHKRFFLEASTASKLSHPNTVTIFDYGRTPDDIYYMAMEYLEGRTLHRALREAGFFSAERAAHIARQICRALREAHSLGVVHRDLKPANIFLMEHGDESDFVKVLDFGLVKIVSEGTGEDLTQTGLFMGSPKYMAPEQIRGERVDARTDIYALGVILYEMVTGKVPFDRPNSVNILMAHVSEPPPGLLQMNPSAQLSHEFEQVVQRCMAKTAEQRFGSMDEVLTALKAIGSGLLTASGGASGAREQRAVVPGSGPGLENRPSATALLSGSSQLGSNALVTDIGSDPTFLSPSPSQTSTPMMVPGRAHAAGALSVSQSTTQHGPTSPRRIAAVAGAAGASAVLVFIALAAVRPNPPDTVHGVKAAVLDQTPVPAKPALVLSPRAGAALALRTAPTATAPASDPVVLPAGSDVPAIAPALARLRISTEPAGASVKEGAQELCSPTPCDVVWQDTDPNRTHRLTISRAGFRPETPLVKGGDEALSVKLTPVPARPSAPAVGPAKSEPPSLPPGYKSEVPY